MIYRGSSISANLEVEKIINIETNISDKGLPTFEIYGLINKSIEESKKRIINSFESSGITFPLKNISINLAPAEIPKEGTHFDFAIAVTILKYTNNFKYDESAELFLGELSFEGRVLPVKNLLFLILSAKVLGYKKIFISKESLDEVYGVDDIEIIGIQYLKDLLNDLNHAKRVPKFPGERPLEETNFSQIIGNSVNKRRLAICLAGSHHLLIEGFPGSGKSLLAKSASELLPDLSYEQAIDVAKIHSYVGLDRGKQLFYRPPFRSPHNSSSYSSIFGSAGRVLNPGEISLANNGVLLLDELPEFNRLVLEGLRIPLEDKVVTISRSKLKKTLNSDFLLIATMNPCKCGYFNHKKILCNCTSSEIKRYKSRISGPILDRIDVILLFDLNTSVNFNNEQEINSFTEFYKLRDRVKNIREYLNNENSTKKRNLIKDNLFEHFNFNDKSINIVKRMQDNYSISNRKLFKLLKLSKTISLFENRECIYPSDVHEAISLVKIK